VLLQVWLQGIYECNDHYVNNWCRDKNKHLHLAQSHKNKGNLGSIQMFLFPGTECQECEYAGVLISP
jgi:hypothetical protein